MTKEQQDTAIAVATVAATIISGMALWISIVTNRNLRRESQLRQILNDFLQIEYTQNIGGNPQTRKGIFAVAQYFRTCLLNGQIYSDPVKSDIESGIARLEILIKTLKWHIKKSSIRHELTAINIQMIVPLLECTANLHPVLNMTIMDYINPHREKLGKIKRYIESY